ncbi:related to phospholipase/esterase [Rhynchosporium secalis]|uniref:Related to phospholipase/esterase n=1 Tax=Rhynchosporium secalis TaxID=38038 RepID=A0A1E1MR68_RHYSE|nr:related to phospholipase/esterase [Rhynchosporium secalis]
MSDRLSSPTGIATHPEPYVRLPTAIHTTTLIILHGTSQTGPQLAGLFLPSKFSLPHTVPANVLTAQVTDNKFTLPECFPGCKFVFPTGAPRKTTVFGGQETHAWFDITDFGDRTKGETQMIDGMRESSLYIAELVRNETELLDGKGDGKVVLAGFSQGSAVGLMLLLTGELHRSGFQPGFGGFIGLSGWLPFRRQIEDIIPVNTSRYICGGIAAGDIDTKRVAATAYIRRLLELDVTNDEWRPSAHYLDAPIFLGHGEMDIKVQFQWGVEMKEVLKKLDIDASFNSYPRLHHWIDEQEMEDVAGFLGTVWQGET